MSEECVPHQESAGAELVNTEVGGREVLATGFALTRKRRRLATEVGLATHPAISALLADNGTASSTLLRETERVTYSEDFESKFSKQESTATTNTRVIEKQQAHRRVVGGVPRRAALANLLDRAQHAAFETECCPRSHL